MNDISQSALPAAVLWDLDGTMIDTEPLWMAAEESLAAQHDASWTEEDSLKLIGYDLMDAGRYIADRMKLDLEPAEIVDHLVATVSHGLATEPVVWRPGARELIEALDVAGVPLALVTMSYADIAAPIAAQFPFAAVVTGELVTKGKPHPEPYLKAAAMLGVEVADCVAIEDSGNGAKSANAAGCYTLVVPNMVRVPEAPRQVELRTLEGLRPEQLLPLFA